MDYIYGTVRRNGVMVENLKTVGDEHTDFSGYISTQRKYPDGVAITDNCRVVEHYRHDVDAEGRCYDWYVIDNHYRYMDTGQAINELAQLREKSDTTAKLSGQLAVAAKLTLRDATTVTDEEALLMPDLFRTWAEALDKGARLIAETILNKDGKLYRVVQSVTPAETQPPDGEGMLAIYRPIDVIHAGTIDDPIPWEYGMDCEAEKYYSYEGGLWLCTADMRPCVWAPGTAGVWQWQEVTE